MKIVLGKSSGNNVELDLDILLRTRLLVFVRIMEEKLGRPLRLGKLVHHKDGKKKNFEKSNLDLTDRSEHARLHFTGAVFSKTHRQKISTALKGRPKSLAHRRAISRSRKRE